MSSMFTDKERALQAAENAGETTAAAAGKEAPALAKLQAELNASQRMARLRAAQAHGVNRWKLQDAAAQVAGVRWGEPGKNDFEDWLEGGAANTVNCWQYVIVLAFHAGWLTREAALAAHWRTGLAQMLNAARTPWSSDQRLEPGDLLLFGEADRHTVISIGGKQVAHLTNRGDKKAHEEPLAQVLAEHEADKSEPLQYTKVRLDALSTSRAQEHDELQARWDAGEKTAAIKRRLIDLRSDIDTIEEYQGLLDAETYDGIKRRDEIFALREKLTRTWKPETDGRWPWSHAKTRYARIERAEWLKAIKTASQA